MVAANVFENLIKYNAGMIDAIGDCPNIESPVYPEPIFGNSIERKGSYDCQINIITGKCRVVSSSGMRVANGSKNVMIEKMKRLNASGYNRTYCDVLEYNGYYIHISMYCKVGV